jgi:hypothetical protein
VHTAFSALKKLLLHDRDDTGAERIYGTNDTFHFEAFKRIFGQSTSGGSKSVFHRFRPSTLLGFLFACAPAQLPLPHEAEGQSAQSYLELLTTFLESADAASNAHAQSKSLEQSCVFYQVIMLCVHQAELFN